MGRNMKKERIDFWEWRSAARPSCRHCGAKFHRHDIKMQTLSIAITDSSPYISARHIPASILQAQRRIGKCGITDYHRLSKL